MYTLSKSVPINFEKIADNLCKFMQISHKIVLIYAQTPLKVFS